MTEMDTLTLVRWRLAEGRTIADADVHRLVAQIDRLTDALKKIGGITMSMCLNYKDMAETQRDIARTALKENDQ